MKKKNKLNPSEVFFATYIATLGLFLIAVVITLAFVAKPSNNQQNKKNNSIFKASQKTINQLKQKQPINKTTRPIEIPNQKRTNPFQ